MSTFKQNTIMDLLPAELWERVLLYLDIPTIGLRVALTCRAMVDKVVTAETHYNYVDDDDDDDDDDDYDGNHNTNNDRLRGLNHEANHLWQALAERKYGKRIVRATLYQYYKFNEFTGNPYRNNPYYDMLRDDNIRGGALPTIHFKSDNVCYYKNNRTDYYFACIVTCLKWDRSNHNLQIYFDARGEQDLRRPETSGVWCEGMLNRNGVRRMHGLPCTSFVNFLSGRNANTRGHYKGVLLFALDNNVNDNVMRDTFIKNGATWDSNYYFCYANTQHSTIQDYEKIFLFELKSGQTLKDVFGTTTNKATYTLHSNSPFDSNEDDDDASSEPERWACIVPPEVLNRHRREGLDATSLSRNRQWWV